MLCKAHHILVIDDDPVICSAIGAFLEELGMDYSTAESGAEVARIIAEKSVCCALVDLSLGKEHGLELLPAIREKHPRCVFMVLTGDNNPSTIVETMREGVFDYLIKPVSFTLFQASLDRALRHYELACERDSLLEDLRQEKALLEKRVADAHTDLRAHAGRIEAANERQQVLIQLNRALEDCYTEEKLFERLYTLLSKVVPVECVALAAPRANEHFVCAAPDENGVLHSIVVQRSDPASSGVAPEPDIQNAELRAAVQEHTGLDATPWTACLYPQKSLGRVSCSVVFFLYPEFEVDKACDEFLQACATTVTTEWQDLRLFQYAAKQTCFGNLMLDLSHDLVEGLTALRVASNVVEETPLEPDGVEGMRIINENVEKLREQLVAIRQVPTDNKSIGKTVRLDELADNAISLLSRTIENGRINIEREYSSNGECVLFNAGSLGTAFLDLISSAVRAVDHHQTISLRIFDAPSERVTFEIGFMGSASEGPVDGRRESDTTAPDASRNHPKYVMAYRTIRGCGGDLSVIQKPDGWFVQTVLLPKNAMSSDWAIEEMVAS